MAEKAIVIIGAGIGGLSAAIRLAAAGKKVAIYEKNPSTGGKMAEYQSEGFRWDTGPSVLTMRHVLDDLFAAAGKNRADYLNLLPIEPLTRYFYPDGTIFDASRDWSKMADEIARLNERDVEGYLRYLAYAAQLHRITGPVFIYDQPPTLKSFARVPITDWLKADPFRTMNRAINSFVQSPHLRQFLGRFATYVGGSPFLAPATLNVIAHVELTGGVWYPQGGMYQMARALEKLAGELGVTIYRGCGAAKIEAPQQRVQAVILENGQRIEADTILCNLDVATTYDRLLKGQVKPAVVQQRTAYPASCSGFILLLGVRGQHPQLAHHNIFFSSDYPREFDAIFAQNRPPDDPTIYLAITSKSDPSHAPEGCENWFILVNVPALSAGENWENTKMPYRDLILEKLAQRGFEVRGQIATEAIFTPADLEQMSGAWRGALYGPSPNDRFAAFLRPHNRSSEIEGLYFAGGTTHPGGGVPMVILSGKAAASMILEDGR